MQWWNLYYDSTFSLLKKKILVKFLKFFYNRTVSWNKFKEILRYPYLFWTIYLLTDMCVYKDRTTHAQGSSWNDGCDLHCTCENATMNIYQCQAK